MKILHYISQYDTRLGGIVQFVGSLCSEIAKRNFAISLVVGDDVDLPRSWIEQQQEDVPRTHVLSHPPGLQQLLHRSTLAEVEEHVVQNDVIHLHGAWDFGNFQIAKIAQRVGKPYVASPHGMLDDLPLSQKKIKKKIFLNLITNRFFRDAAVVHCTAEGEADQVKKNVKSIGRTICIPPIARLPELSGGDSQEVFKRFARLDRMLPKILFLGRIHQIKGLEQLIDACGILKRNGVALQLVLAGPGDPGYINKLKKRISDLGISNQTIWLGAIENDFKSAVYNACDIFALPTLHENFGIVLAEAALAGLPVVTTRHTNIHKELAQHGALIADSSGESFATNLSKLIHDSARKKTGLRLRQGVQHWLAPDKVVGQYVQLYTTAISRH